MSTIERFHACLTSYATSHAIRSQVYTKVIAGAHDILSHRRAENQLRPPGFNIFYALGHAYREVGTHSAMLAYLLDPMKGHDQGTLFLSLFLDALKKAADSQGLDINIPRVESAVGWSCRKEFVLPEPLGRLDLMLQGPEILIVVENKVRAGLGPDQLDRYWSFAEKHARAGGRKPILVYLTPDGEKPTGGGQAGEKTLIPLSYRYDLYSFLRLSVGSVKAISVAEVVRQYADLVRDI